MHSWIREHDQYEKLGVRIVAIQWEKEDEEYRAKRISPFMRMLAGQEACSGVIHSICEEGGYQWEGGKPLVGIGRMTSMAES